MSRCLFWVLLLTLSLVGCVTYESACHELVSLNSGEIERRSQVDSDGTFERHFILLETGNGTSSQCQSRYISQATFQGLPGSLQAQCDEQKKPSETYCTLYLLDGDVVKQPVEHQ